MSFRSERDWGAWYSWEAEKGVGEDWRWLFRAPQRRSLPRLSCHPGEPEIRLFLMRLFPKADLHANPYAHHSWRAVNFRSRSYHRFIKKAKLRAERRRATRDPETLPAYGRYSGWES